MQIIYQNIDPGGRRSDQRRRKNAHPNYKGIERRILEDRRKGSPKRKSPRFRVKEGSFAAIDSSYGIIGHIKNINRRGLAFQYFPDEKQLSGQVTIDIFHKSKEFYLKSLPFKTISDFYVERNSPFSTTILRQCCGKFAALTGNQISQIDCFIQNYTIGEA